MVMAEMKKHLPATQDRTAWSKAQNQRDDGSLLVGLSDSKVTEAGPGAVLVGALKINNVTPGPTIDPEIILRVVAIMVLTPIGSYSVGGNFIDLCLRLAEGGVAHFINRLKFPIAPLVIGDFLEWLIDETFRRQFLYRRVTFRSLLPGP